MDQATSSHSVQCVVVTPERTVLDEPVDFVALPMYDGELGVLPGRAPLIGRLGAGELRTTKAGRVQRYYVDGGFAQVRANVVTVLTPKAVRAEDLSPAAIEAQLAAAHQPAVSPEAGAAQQRTVEKARVQRRIAEKASSATGH